jgi:lactoylglutathione lyase
MLLAYCSRGCAQKGIMPDPEQPRAVGLNHVALEVCDIEEMLTFYGKRLDNNVLG